MKKLRLFLKAFPLVGRVFYVPKLRQFFQVKVMYLRGAECSDFTNFYSDARTNICRQMLSYSFLAECVLVDTIDTFEFAEQVKIGSNYYAWRAK